MSQRVASNRGRKQGGRSLVWVWIGVVVLVIFLLIYFEQTAILYVLATLGLTALLLIVAFADLKDAPNASDLPKPHDDAAAIGTGIGSTLSPTATTPRASNKRR
ncbi:MAG TPA: hypothetical protein VJS44_05850 [Pyrinomonadaceae bacterium]|nr:hypothetical protein [Pyrinomonadaceae bacterium]